jgi:type I restriction enzyme S subunit
MAWDIVNNWKETTLGEVAELAKDQWMVGDEDQKYIGLEHINQGDLQINGFGCSSSLQSNKFYFKEGDVLFGKLRPYFRKVWKASFDGVCSTDIWVIRAKEGYDQNFLFYFMANPVLIDKSTGASTGTKMPRADWDFLKGTEWSFPPLPEQKAIAAILSGFDDKIELLRRQNKTLESIARTIFKEWFVKFKVNGQKLKMNSKTGLPEGWRMGKLGEELLVAIGGDWGEETKTNSDDVQAYCLRGTDIDSLKLSGYSAQVPIRWIRKNSLEKRAITEKDILIGGSGLGPIGKTVYCHRNINLLYGLPITYSNFCKRLTAKNKYYALYFEYLISALYSRGALERFSIGTSIPNLDINGLLEEKVIIPMEKHIEDFSKILDVKYSKLMNPQIQTLSKLRDALLPKLMKGEIRVKP